MTTFINEYIIINKGVDCMINCFKQTQGLYWGVIVPVSVLAMLAANFLIEKPVVAFLAFFIPFIIGTNLLQRLAVKKYTEKNKVLEEKCDCVAYLAWQQEMMSKKLKGAYKNLVMLNLATAYYYCGDFQLMKYTLEGIDTGGMKGRLISYLYSYYRLWFLYYITLSNLPEAEKVFESLNTLPVPKDEKSKKLCEYIIAQSRLTIESRKGQVLHIEERLRMMRLEDKMLSIVCENNFLGKYYLKNGMRDKAKECYAFVAEHGNNLFIAKAAREILEENLNKGDI